MIAVIDNYIKNSNKEYQRYNSWNHCYKAFGNESINKDTLALHLGFYLASWGMYRGSSGLLQKDYKLHLKAVSIIKKYSCLRNSEISNVKIEHILNLIKELQCHYKSYTYETTNGITKNISPTDTLMSKIVLGTLGCLPAFDRFFIEGVKLEKLEFKSLHERSLEKLFEFSLNFNVELTSIKTKYPQYPIMKLIDMYFWQIGFDLGKSKKQIPF